MFEMCGSVLAAFLLWSEDAMTNSIFWKREFILSCGSREIRVYEGGEAGQWAAEHSHLQTASRKPSEVGVLRL